MSGMFGFNLPLEGAADRVSEWIGGDNDYQRQRKIELEQQRQMDYNTNRYGLVGKVEGAKSLGLHPLAALGSTIAGGGSAGPGAFGNMSFSNDPPVENSGGPEKDPDIARYNRARARKAELEADALERDLKNSQSRLAGQPGNAPVMTSDGVDVTTPAQTYPVRHSYKFETQNIPAMRPNDATTTAGPAQPLVTEYMGQDIYGNPVVFKAFSQNASEAFEGMGEIPGMIQSTPLMLNNAWEMFMRTPVDHLRGKPKQFYPSGKRIIRDSRGVSTGRSHGGKVQ